jgi:hypothetical protein
MESQVPVFISPRSGVAQLYPQALGSLFIASYDLEEVEVLDPAATYEFPGWCPRYITDRV